VYPFSSEDKTADRHGGHGSPKETVLKEVTAAGFQVLRGPEFWRGRTYGVCCSGGPDRRFLAACAGR